MSSTELRAIDVHDTTAALTPFSQSNAQTMRAIELPGARLSQYTNANEQVYYEEQQIHTFSMYLEGGFQTHRTDVAAPHGAPGRFCLMPAGSYSAWEIGSAQQFVHVYFDDSYIKRLALQNLDIDPRLVSLPHLTFENSDKLNTLVQHSLLNCDWSFAENRMLMQHSLQNLLLHLLDNIGLKNANTQTLLKSGLSPIVQKRMQAYIEEYYQRQISLSELAEVSGLSEYHFARMFKISFACTPQNYISQLRIKKLQARIKHSKSNSHLSLAELAIEFGFSSQSHMGRVFKQHTGMTPKQFARIA